MLIRSKQGENFIFKAILEFIVFFVLIAGGYVGGGLLH